MKAARIPPIIMVSLLIRLPKYGVQYGVQLSCPARTAPHPFEHGLVIHVRWNKIFRNVSEDDNGGTESEKPYTRKSKLISRGGLYTWV